MHEPYLNAGTPPSAASRSSDYLDSCSLDMIAPITQGQQPEPGGLLALWDEVILAELPSCVRAYVQSQLSLTPTVILTSLLDPSAVAEACMDFIETARRFLTSEFDARSAEIALQRAGLLTDDVPTLEEVGRQFGLTRERVRQIEKRTEGVVKEPGQIDANLSKLQRAIKLRAARNARTRGVGQKFADIVLRQPLAHTIRAWFDVNRGRPLTDADLKMLLAGERRARCCRRALEVLKYPHASLDGNFWFRTEAERGACQAIIDAADAWTGAQGWAEVAQQVRDRIPGIERTLDVQATVQRLGESRDCGPGPDGYIVAHRSRLVRRMARKIVTYLIARAAPVSVDELASAISAGQAPFQVFLRPFVVPASWLEECVAASNSLIQTKDGRIALAHSHAARVPTGTAGVLYSIVSRHGEPIRMQDLCDKAAAFGLSRNQTGTLIHGRRAACLFMLSRGIVGLVGRDEGANPTEYEITGPERKRVRPGHEIGWEDDGSLAADIQVRRSIREQGLGLPWPFSLALFSGTSRLLVDGDRVALLRKPNGDLDLPQLVPGDVVRIAFRLRPSGPILSVNTKLRPQLNSIRLTGVGSSFPVGLPPRQGRPGWVAEFEERHNGKLFIDLDAISSTLPAALSARRRLYALHALVPLGIVRHTSMGWRVTEGQSLPSALSAAFELAANDPGVYPTLVGYDRAAVAWLVRAAWLTPNIGWSVVRYNDLSRDVELDPLLPDTGAPGSIGIREAALMRIVETAGQAADRLEHPGNHDLLDETGVLVRRYLTALGYTAYHSVRDLARGKSWVSISYASSSDGDPNGVWILKPVGARILESDLALAKYEAKKIGSPTWAVTNAMRLKGAQIGREFDIDLRSVARVERSFNLLVQLAADPSDFLKIVDPVQDDDGDE